MSQDITALQAQWNDAIEAEDSYRIENLVREILTEHAETTLACEIRYKRGVITLTEGEGFGSERLARALNEFTQGLKSGVAVGPEAEPWRSLNHTQLAVCHARRNNIDGALEELKTITTYKPKNTVGLGAFLLMAQILEANGREQEAKRLQSRRLSYARSLVRENAESEDIHNFRFLLAQELLSSTYAKEGQELLEELYALDVETLGEDLYEDLQEFRQIEQSKKA